MQFILKFLTILLIAFVVIAQCKPVEESALDEGEIMETAEGQNPFLPRFAMKRLKERREKARAQRRNEGQRMQPQPPQHGTRCPQNPYRRYYKK